MERTFFSFVKAAKRVVLVLLSCMPLSKICKENREAVSSYAIAASDRSLESRMYSAARAVLEKG